MSLSVKDDTKFAVSVGSPKGSLCFNVCSRSSALIIRFLLVAALSLAVSQTIFAQNPIGPGINNVDLDWNGAYTVGPPLPNLTITGGTGGLFSQPGGRNFVLYVDGQLYHDGGMGIRELNGIEAGTIYINNGRNVNAVTRIISLGMLQNYGNMTNFNQNGYLWVGASLTNGASNNIGTISDLGSIYVGGSLNNIGNITNVGGGYSMYGGVGSPYTIYAGGNLTNGDGVGGAAASTISGAANSYLDIYVGGNLENYYDGTIQANWYGGELVVGGSIYNAGQILTTNNYPQPGWTIRASSLINDGLLVTQNGGAGADFNGIIQDAYILLDGDLLSTGANALIDGAYNATMGNTMHIGGGLYNWNRSTIQNYGNILVHGNLENSGVILGGHWNLDTDASPLVIQGGFIAVYGNVKNFSEMYGWANTVYGGLIAGFDKFQVHGSLTNDAQSTIRAGYENNVIGEGAGGVPYAIAGRRATVVNGVLLDGGEYYDAASVLDVAGSVMNEGNIREIDYLYVGTTEDDVLWNAVGTQIANMTLLLADNNAVSASGTITDIGVINATNVVNEGTINNINGAINVAYLLWNDATGVMDGQGTDSNGTITYTQLKTGTATAASSLGADLAGLGIYNAGTLSNFSSVTTTGELINEGILTDITSITVGSPAAPADMINFGTITNVSGITVTGALHIEQGSIFTNLGTVTAQGDVIVDGDLNGGFRILDSKAGTLQVNGSLTIDAGSIASGNKVVNGTSSLYGGGFLMPATIINNGVLISSTLIDNYGTIQNEGTVTSFDNFWNVGTISGNGIVFISGANRRFINNGTIAGGITINGNFSNAGGDIAIDIGDIIHVVNGTATIEGGTVSVTSGSNTEVGKQYLFLTTQNPGDLKISSVLTGTGSGQTGQVLNFTPYFGRWDGSKYVAGEMWSKDNQYYWFEVGRAYKYGPYGETYNQRSVGEYIDSIGSAPRQNSALWGLLQNLDYLSERNPNPANLNPNPYMPHGGGISRTALRALDELSGAIYSTIGTASVHNTGVVNSTLADTLRSDVFKFSYIGNPNNAIRGQAIAPLRWNRWGTGFGIGGVSRYDGNASGYRESFGGVMAGFDRSIWTGSRFGMYLSGANGHVSMRDLDERTQSTDVLVGLYLRQEMYYGYGLAAMGFGQNTYKTERHLNTIGYDAENKHHATVGTLYLERGIDIPVYYATVQPYANFQIVSVDQGDFTEKMRGPDGRYANIGIENVKAKTDSFRIAFGTRGSSNPIPLPWGQIALTGNIAWFHDFATASDRDFIARFSNSGGANYGSQFASTTYKVYGNDPKQDWFNAGWGIHFDRNSNRVFLNGDIYANSRQVLYTGNGGFIMSW